MSIAWFCFLQLYFQTASSTQESDNDGESGGGGEREGEMNWARGVGAQQEPVVRTAEIIECKMCSLGAFLES